jgi:hypothetical protein
VNRATYAVQLLGQFVAFAREYKAYWIIPMVLLLALVLGVIVAAQSSAPFIYALF